MRVCNVTTCRRPARAKGLCERHYRRLLRHGDPQAGDADRPGRQIETILARTGLTYRRLDYWTSQGYLHASTPANPGYGNRRDWPDDELAIATTMARLTAAGVSVTAAARLARALHRDGHADLAGWRLAKPP